MCWHCKTGQYLVYESDPDQLPRCGQCGEFEQDDPAKSKPAPVKRAAPKNPRSK